MKFKHIILIVISLIVLTITCLYQPETTTTKTKEVVENFDTTPKPTDFIIRIGNEDPTISQMPIQNYKRQTPDYSQYNTQKYIDNPYLSFNYDLSYNIGTDTTYEENQLNDTQYHDDIETIRKSASTYGIPSGTIWVDVYDTVDKTTKKKAVLNDLQGSALYNPQTTGRSPPFVPSYEESIYLSKYYTNMKAYNRLLQNKPIERIYDFDDRYRM